MPFIPKPVATAKDWIGTWSMKYRAVCVITEDIGDTVNVELVDYGIPGGPTQNPEIWRLPVSVLVIKTPVDLALHRYRYLESFETVNQFTLDSGAITLTLLADIEGGVQTRVAPLIRYQRRLDIEGFGVTVDLGYDGP